MRSPGEHREVVVRAAADVEALVRAAVLEGHERALRAVEDVVVRDDVPRVRPHEARALAARNLGDPEEASIRAHALGRVDVHDAQAAGAEERDRRLLPREQRAARCDFAGGCRAVVQWPEPRSDFAHEEDEDDRRHRT
jgi:hypothetical protein